MARSKVPPRTSSAPPPKLAAAAAAAAAQQQQQQQQAIRQQQQQQQPTHASTPPRATSPSLAHDGESVTSSSKKKKKKSKAKARDADLVAQGYDIDDRLGPRPTSPSAISATAQAQADLLATASDLYRRIEADPHGIPDDDAYWTSLPAHLRTFIRNALPLGQFPPSAQAALNGNPNDPNARHASTQAMIAVAQQLAQAAHASQRHLQQFPPGTHPYPPLPFDPSIFADLALHPDQPLPLHPHPNSGVNMGSMPNGNHAAYAHGHVQYTTSSNPPPTQPPGEPLPAPVVLVNEYGEEAGDYDDEYYSEDELDHDGAVIDHRGRVIQTANGMWMQDDVDRMDGHHDRTLAAPAGTGTTTSKSKKKKKKKKGAASANQTAADLATGQPYDAAAHTHAAAKQPQPPSATVPPNASGKTASSQPPPSSRAAGKQPMTFNSSGKAPARPANGVPPPPSSNAAGKRPLAGSIRSGAHAQGKGAAQPARIWSTSSIEERDRIKEFWLGLSERDRRELVKLEKETVLKKMKDQQKHGCTCAVCGRKRSAIEDELEVLYDAYYDELEEYANHQQRWQSSGGTIPPPPGPGPFPGSVALDSNGAVIGGDQLSRARSQPNHRDGRHGHGGHHHPQAHGVQKKAPAPLHPESSDGYDDDELDDEEFDDEDDEEYDDEEEDDEADLEREREDAAAAAAGGIKKGPGGGVGRRRSIAAAGGQTGQNDLFGLGSSLTVKGGILTVADDLLKNDGQKFLEMMEQLAERRMQREEEAGIELGESEDEDDEDPVDDLDDDDEEDLEDEEDEEDDIMTDEQRMEEGRRMFQIFAARMFEQRVLQAYREKVAQERQLQLLRELEEEDMNEKAKEAKRQKDNQKKKDKKRMQREQREAERLRKEEERAAEEAAAKARAEKQREADLKRQEELRAKREAERRAKEEEKARKEEEKRKRQAEERERELERERKKKEKEEKARLEREAKERERKQKEEEARRAREEKEKAEREQLERSQKAKAEEAKKAEAARKEKEAADKTAAAQAKQQQQQQQQRAAAEAAATAGSSSQTPVERTSSASPSAKTALRSPGAGVPQGPAGRSKSGSLQDSPSSAPTGSKSGSGGRASQAQRQAQAAGSGSSLPSVAPSTLPAPPQGLPPRPSNAVVNPSGFHQASQGPASVSVSANAGLPRPPVSSGVPTSAVPSLGFGSIGPQSFGATGSGKATPSTAAPKAPQTPQQQQGQQPHFAHHSLPQHHPSVSPGSASAGSRTMSGFGSATFDALRSPTLPNGISSGIGLAGKGSVDSALQSPSLGSLGSATNSLASLNLGANPVGSALHGSKQAGIGLAGPSGPGGSSQASSSFIGHGLPASSHGGIPPIGQPTEPLRSRAPSMADSDQLSSIGVATRSSSALSQRPIQRPNPAPIGPIGRPRPAESHAHDDPFGMGGGNGRSSSSASNSGPASPKLPQGILGSSALGGDDELVEPKPRRVSNTVPISGGGGAGGGSFFGMGSGAVGANFGMGGGGPSPWNTFSGGVGSAPGGPLSPGFSNAAPGAGASSFGSSLNMPATSSAAPGSVDPWARAQSSWDRARSAFEQPGGGFGQIGGLGGVGSQLLHGNNLGHPGQHQGLGGPAGGATMSPFGAPRSIFGGGATPVLASQHPGAIGSSLSPTSPGSRHAGNDGRSDL